MQFHAPLMLHSSGCTSNRQRPMSPALTRLGVLALLLITHAAVAGPGHDRGDAPPAPVGSALPRFTATSDLFEMVGILDGRQLTVYVDHAATNAPVRSARVELELGGKALPLQSRADGEFVATLEQIPGPGSQPVTATIIAGKDSDLLAGELDLHASSLAKADEHDHGSRAWLPWALGGAAALLCIVVAYFTRRRRSRVVAAGEQT